MTVCESEENRRKAAWLVPGYILLAWFLCVVFQPLGFTNVPGKGNNNDLNDESLYDIINLQDDPQVDNHLYNLKKERRRNNVSYWLSLYINTGNISSNTNTWPISNTEC